MATKTFNISFPAPLAKRVDQLARHQRTSRSELLRIAANDYLDRRERWDQMARDLQQQAKRLGIRTMDDVDRLVHEVRDEIAAEEKVTKRS
jgi:metal-responsive CopG/Arc/MetJ family transcriptional regulator